MSTETRAQATMSTATAFLDLYRSRFNCASSLTGLNAAGDSTFNAKPFLDSINMGISTDDAKVGRLLLDTLNFADIPFGSGGFGKTEFGNYDVYNDFRQFYESNFQKALPRAIRSDGARLLLVDSNPDGLENEPNTHHLDI